MSLKTFYNLPEKVEFCKLCVNSNQYPASTIEFKHTKNRKGANNVFTISKNGGVPKQLTYYPTADIPYDWTASNNIVFATTRVLKGPEWDEQIYHVNSNGGTPQRFITDLGSMATVSPDGNLVAYVKGACRISREDYTGSAQRDVWIYNIKNGSYFQLTSSKKNDHSPLWDAEGNLYYISAESGRYNIYKQSINTDGSTKGSPKKTILKRYVGWNSSRENWIRK